MLKPRKLLLLVLLPCLLHVGTALAAAPARGDVEVVLQQHKVVKRDSKEVLEAVDRIRPGETVEYQAIYRNVSGKVVHKLQATLPIPAETEYLAGSAKPANVEASTDGKSYAAVPLRKKIRLANGQIEERDVPASEYRSLRWSIGDLAAGQKVAVFARVRLAPVGQAPTEEGKK